MKGAALLVTVVLALALGACSKDMMGNDGMMKDDKMMKKDDMMKKDKM